MNRYLPAALLFSALFLLACGDDSDPPCDCLGEIKADCLWECSAPEGNVGKATGPLSPTLAARWTITSDSAPASDANCNAGVGPWAGGYCSCGYNYGDAGASCVEPNGAVMIFEYPTPGVPVAAGARFRLDTSVGAYANPNPVVAKLRVLKRPVARPPASIACASSAVSSWFRYGGGAWEIPGAAGSLDRTDASAPRLDSAGNTLSDSIAPHDDSRQETWDVTEILNACPASGQCYLALYLDSGVHLNAPGGTAALTWLPAGPPTVCGDGAIGGTETCDDGDAASGDGCSATCGPEAGWSCSGAPSTCATSCGDGVAAGSEECDDGNASDADACTTGCIAQSCTLVCE